MAHQTTSSHYQPGGVNPGARLQQVGKTIIANDGTTNIGIFGYNSALQKWGGFFTKNGVDVMTNTDLSQFIFNSDQNTFKIVETLIGNFETGSVTSNNTQVQTNLVAVIPHEQTYIPSFLAYVQLSGASYCLMPYTTMDIFGSTINNYAVRTYSVTANATNIFVTLQVTQVTTSNTTIAYGGEPVKVYILQETAN